MNESYRTASKTKESHRPFYSCAGYSAGGVYHAENQDRYRANSEGMVLADGVGGLAAGELFAELACWVGNKLLGDGASASEAIRRANQKTLAVEKALGCKGGAAACAVKLLGDGSFDACIAGDVRLYRFENGELTAVFEDRTNRNGTLSDYVGRALSGANDQQGTSFEIPQLRRGDALVALTDGIWRFVPEKTIARICESHRGNAGSIARQLVEAAGERCSYDDKTAVAFVCQ